MKSPKFRNKEEREACISLMSAMLDTETERCIEAITESDSEAEMLMEAHTLRAVRSLRRDWDWLQKDYE